MYEIFGLPYYYFLLVIPACFAVYHFYNDNKKSIKKGVEIAKAVKNRNKKFCIKQNQKISEDQYRDLLQGAMLAQYSEDNLNELVCLSSVEELKEGLNEWWGIHDRDSFLSSIDWLFETGHRNYYAPLLEIIENYPKENRSKVVSKLSDQFGRDLSDFAENLPFSLALFKKEGVLKEGDEKIDVLSWDMGRVINLSRAAFTIGYIKEKEAWELIEKAADLMKLKYKNWEETARGFMLGRGMWTANPHRLNYTIQDYKLLTSDADSPYNYIPFK